MAQVHIDFMLASWNEGADDEDKANPKDLLGESLQAALDIPDGYKPLEEEYDPLDLPEWACELGVHYNGDMVAVVVTDGMYASCWLFERT